MATAARSFGTQMMLGPADTGVLQLEYLHRTSPAKEVRMTPNISDIIRHHVSLEVRCIDRVYLHAYMPKLQTSGGLCYFLHDYLGYPVPSPALIKPRHDRFIAAVQAFADRQRIPVVPFERGESKDALVAKYRARCSAREGVVSSAWPKRKCGPSRRTNGRAVAGRPCLTSRGNRWPSTTITSSCTIGTGDQRFLKVARICRIP
jgi:hypothetical protein